jgi:hypothetical protein
MTSDTFLFLNTDHKMAAISIKEGRHGWHDLISDKLASLLPILVQ